MKCLSCCTMSIFIIYVSIQVLTTQHSCAVKPGQAADSDVNLQWLEFIPRDGTTTIVCQNKIIVRTHHDPDTRMRERAIAVFSPGLIVLVPASQRHNSVSLSTICRLE